jgi:integrase
MDGQGKVNEYVKMGDDRDPRYRGTLLIDWALEMMDPWLELAREDEFLFTFKGDVIRKDLLQDRLRSAISRAGIPTEGRRFIPYSGRYTFNTTLRPFLPAAVLMAIMGHVDPAMPERYDVPVLLERMRQLAPYREEINRAIG